MVALIDVSKTLLAEQDELKLNVTEKNGMKDFLHNNNKPLDINDSGDEIDSGMVLTSRHISRRFFEAIFMTVSTYICLDDDLTTIGSTSSLDVGCLSLLPFPQENWEFEILRDSPFYCEGFTTTKKNSANLFYLFYLLAGDESDEYLTGPYKILNEERQRESLLRLRYFPSKFDHVKIEPVKVYDKKLISGNRRSFVYPHQFDDASSEK